MTSAKIWLSSPHMGGSEEFYIQEAIRSNWVAPLGPNVDCFEEILSNYLSTHTPNHVVALSSGTAALHLALKILEVGPGDVVVVQSFTFCGTTNPVKYLGAEIVFVDSERETWNMCPDALARAMEVYRDRRIKAVIPVHLYGMPANILEIRKIADQFHVPIIEDAAESLGSTLNGQACGSFGVMGVLSFNGNKIITTSGGGALVSNNEQFVESARFLASQARDNAPHYQHSKIGFNYRLSNILAGIGRGQMEFLDERVAQRRANNKRYREFFSDVIGVSFQTEPSSNYFSNYWLTAILIEPSLTGGISREDVRLALEAVNIESRPLWKPMHMQPVNFGSRFFGSGVCEELFEKGLCLPSGSNLTDIEFDRIFSVLAKIFKK